MAEEVRLWSVGEGDTLSEISRSRLNIEQRVENWIAQDSTVLDPGMLVIGRQVATDFGGYIDLLCLNSDGNTVILELKRDKTPREITAQVLDYASWVRTLSAERISAIAHNYLKEPLEDAFRRRFSTELPDVINEQHSMVIVGSEIDDSSERIVHYLSETYGISINAATFGFFRGQNGQEFLARTFLVQPAEVRQRSSETSHRRTNLSFEQLQDLADAHGVGTLYRTLSETLRQWFWVERRTVSVTFGGDMPDGSGKSILGLLPEQSNPENGLRFQLYMQRLAIYSGETEEKLLEILPSHREPYSYYPDAPVDLQGWAGFFANETEAKHFIEGLRSTKLSEHAKGDWHVAGLRAAETRRKRAASAAL